MKRKNENRITSFIYTRFINNDNNALLFYNRLLKCSSGFIFTVPSVFTKCLTFQTT